jgi:NADPH2:quinone reductase
MSHAIRIHRYGGPEVMQWEAVEVGAPGPGEVRLRHTAVGLNFIDVYERTGLYEGTLPKVLGKEAAAVVEAIGPRVKDVAVGDRVAYQYQVSGAYSQERVVPADRLIKLPDGIADVQGAAIMLKGLTAQMLLRQTYRVRKGDTVLIHAAAGGVGLIAVQWAKHLGATVIATVGSQEKAALVKEQHADHVLLIQEDWVAAVKTLTGGKGVNVVYDSVGKDTFSHSLDCLKPRGMMVSFGNSSGPVAPMAPLELTKRGSLYLTRPTLFHYTGRREELRRAAKELLDLVARSVIAVHVGQTYPLQDVARAHRDLESRQTTGSTVLLP